VLLQVLIGGGGVEDLLAQGFDLGVEVFDAVLPVGDQEVGRGGVLPGGMELVLGLGSELVERRDAACTGADRQGQGIGALPECEGRAVGEFGQERGIDGIGFGPRLHGFGEAFGSLGVDHHDLKSGIIQGQCHPGGNELRSPHPTSTISRSVPRQPVL